MRVVCGPNSPDEGPSAAEAGTHSRGVLPYMGYRSGIGTSPRPRATKLRVWPAPRPCTCAAAAGRTLPSGVSVPQRGYAGQHYVGRLRRRARRADSSQRRAVSGIVDQWTSTDASCVSDPVVRATHSEARLHGPLRGGSSQVPLDNED